LCVSLIGSFKNISHYHDRKSPINILHVSDCQLFTMVYIPCVCVCSYNYNEFFINGEKQPPKEILHIFSYILCWNNQDVSTQGVMRSLFV